jgi:hypothetical protein
VTPADTHPESPGVPAKPGHIDTVQDPFRTAPEAMSQEVPNRPDGGTKSVLSVSAPQMASNCDDN